MEFLAPLMLVGAAGAAIPILIHLIGRRRARRVRFAAMDFLLGSDRKVKRRLLLRERLLLLARVLACVALALVLAKPFTSCEDHGAAVTRGPQAAVIVIDDAYASGYRVAGERLIDREKREAARLLAQLGPEAEVAVVTTSADGRLPGELSRDHIKLRDQIAVLEPTARLADTSAALARAAALLLASNHASRTLYLLSPVAAVGLAGEPPWPPGQGPALVHVDPAEGAPLDNAAITAVDLALDPEAGPRAIRVTADAVLHGGAPGSREVRLELAGAVVARGKVALEPGKASRTSFSAALPAGARVSDLVVSLAEDALPVDDRRYAVAAPRAAVRVLLVDGDPRTVRHDDELFYLGVALRPGDRGDSGAELTRVLPDALAELDLAAFDVVVLANVRALPAAAAARLSTWVTAGGGLWITAGDHVDPDAYNRQMAALLPQKLATAIDTSFGQSGGGLRLTKLEVDHPLFAAFEKDARGLAEAQFRKVLLLGPTTEVAGRRVLARFDNGAVALIEADSGQGRLLFYTSSIDRDWTDLPLQPGFLPLAQQAVRYLAKKPAEGRRRELRIGDHMMLDVAPDSRRLEVARPGDDDRTLFEGEQLIDRKQVRFADTARPGIYRIFDVSREGKRTERTEASFAVNLDPRGADLTRAAPDRLPQAGDGVAAPAGDRHLRRIELWHAVAAALLLFLLIESLILLRP